MKKHLSTICILAIVLLSATGAYAALQKDPKETAARLLQESVQAQEQARQASCDYLGTVTANCYKNKGKDCQEMDEAEAEHRANFNADAYDDCFDTTPRVAPGSHGTDTGTEIHETEVATPEGGKPVDPLFRGDEEGN